VGSHLAEELQQLLLLPRPHLGLLQQLLQLMNAALQQELRRLRLRLASALLCLRQVHAGCRVVQRV
jgi:hypothetical protein